MRSARASCWNGPIMAPVCQSAVHLHSHISVTVSQAYVIVNSNNGVLHKACLLSVCVLHTQDVSFQFCNELFSQRSAVRSCVMCWQQPSSDLGAGFIMEYWVLWDWRGSSRWTFQKHSRCHCASNNNSPAYGWIMVDNGFLLMGEQWSLGDKDVSRLLLFITWVLFSAVSCAALLCTLHFLLH